MKRACYTPAEDERIRAVWPDVPALAAELGREPASVVTRALRLDLPRRIIQRPYTEAELQIVRDRYATEGAKPIARDLGRGQSAIVALAGRLGLVCLRPWTADEDQAIRQMKQEGRSQKEIAVALGRTVSAAAKRIQFLGLAKPLFDPIAHRAKLTRLHQPGSNPGPETRWARARIRMGEHGWPPDLNPKEIAILNALQRGPQTRKAISLSIGERVDLDERKRLRTHGGISAMARLLARGIVARLRLQNGRQCTHVYTLTAAAIENRGRYQGVQEFNQQQAERRPA